MDNQADALQARARARIGQVLREKWRLDKLLGVGGMAVVYAATHVNNGRRVAIKLLHSELSVNAEVRTRFLREGYVANKVEHPGTVAVLDDQVCDDGSVFLVMELLEGETLEDRRERSGSLPAHEVLSLADRLLDVLAVAHDKGVVHRDIKPENIFLTREGAVKVLDFGIARIRELQAARLTLTSAGAIGTPAFMPPEQARGRWDDVGPRSDIWAVGATMFTLVTGRLVHQAETVNELMLAAMTKHAPPLGSLLPSLPPPVAAVIDRALAYDLRERWPDARAMQAALRSAYQSFAEPPMPSGAFRAFVAGPPSGPVSAPIPVSSMMQAPGAAAAMNAQGAAAMAMPAMAAPGGSTGQPVTMIGGATSVRLPNKRGFPLLPVMAGLVGALVVGVVVLLVATHPSASGTSASASASAPAPSAQAATTSAMATGSEAASATATATASTPEAPASAKPAATASATPSATPKGPWKPRPGSAWPRPKR